MEIVNNTNKDRLMAGSFTPKHGTSSKIKPVNTLKLVQHKIEMLQYI